ncbi:DUF2726 domain-containing protein [Frankia sp. Cas3]|uniref:DUF2726 domain-containing protein n=1 Tax=Frankia sp. Cas3 TaxID=3073926 RepID=UPI003A0FEB1B
MHDIGVSEPGWRKPLLTASERRAEWLLTSIVEHHGARILPSVKLSQVIDQRPAGVTAEQWNYATRAHFDFVVCDAATSVPDFAVELDDPTHDRPDRQRHDRMKEAICEAAGLELLRIESSAFAPGPRGRRLVEYLIEARAYCKAFYQAQKTGPHRSTSHRCTGRPGM